MTTSQIKDKITSSGLKGTHQRIAIYEALINLENHPTAEMIYNAIKKKYPTISLGTVYKTLETFVEKRLINRVLTTNDIMRYDAITKPHHHLFDKSSGKIIDYDDDQLFKVIEKHLKKKDIPFFNISSIHVRINGESIERQQKLEF